MCALILVLVARVLHWQSPDVDTGTQTSGKTLEYDLPINAYSPCHRFERTVHNFMLKAVHTYADVDAFTFHFYYPHGALQDKYGNPVVRQSGRYIGRLVLAGDVLREYRVYEDVYAAVASDEMSARVTEMLKGSERGHFTGCVER